VPRTAVEKPWRVGGHGAESTVRAGNPASTAIADEGVAQLRPGGAVGVLQPLQQLRQARMATHEPQGPLRPQSG